MLIKTLCLAGEPDRLQSALVDSARGAKAAIPALGAVHVYRVLRHIPTDSVAQTQSAREIVQGVARVGVIVECEFGDEESLRHACMQPGWHDFAAAMSAEGEMLFGFDALSNVPIAPMRGAVHGGFRRWMLLRRAAPAPAAFRDAWFGRHAALVRQLPAVDGYLQNLVTARFDPQGEAADYASLPVDGIAELCYADEETMLASYASDARLPLRDDGRALLGGIATLLVHGRSA